MNTLVTGGAGYVGAILVPILLNAGHRVRVLDTLMYGGHSLLGVWSHPRFEFVRGDVRDAETVRFALRGIEAVVHLAAIVGDPACARQPDLARTVNLDATLMLLEECERAEVSRFVFASTCSNYGKMPDPRQYVDENGELHPLSLYAETKVAAEKAVLRVGREGGMCTTSLRFATIFGVSPRMRFDLTINHFTMELLTKRRLVVFGEHFWRPYVHVRDAARAVLKVLMAPASKVAGEVFNVGSTNQNYQKRQIVDLIRPYAPDATVEYIQKQEDPRDYRVSFAKIRKVLGFRITRTVEDGIREVAQLIQSGLIENYDDPRYRN